MFTIYVNEAAAFSLPTIYAQRLAARPELVEAMRRSNRAKEVNLGLRRLEAS